jgi:hypothetical protein
MYTLKNNKVKVNKKWRPWCEGGFTSTKEGLLVGQINSHQGHKVNCFIGKVLSDFTNKINKKTGGCSGRRLKRGIYEGAHIFRIYQMKLSRTLQEHYKNEIIECKEIFGPCKSSMP